MDRGSWVLYPILVAFLWPSTDAEHRALLWNAEPPLLQTTMVSVGACVFALQTPRRVLLLGTLAVAIQLSAEARLWFEALGDPHAA